jgi:DNA-binding transcriptional MerR regulator
MTRFSAKYSIKDLERLSGVKAHTIRIWEQRYNLLNPERTDTNIRFYNDDDLKHLLNISLLIRSGGKISHICQMTQEQIFQKIQQLVINPISQDVFFSAQTDNLIMSMLELDDFRFEKTISTSTLKFGFEQTMLHVIIPFLYKVGIMWRTGEANIIQEHFISNLIRKKILVAIDGYVGTQSSKPDTWVLFLPEGELHEIGLLFAQYILKIRGKRIIYLGQTTPLADVVACCNVYNPDYLLTFFTAAYSHDHINTYINELMALVPEHTNLFVAGGQVKDIDLSLNHRVEILGSVQSLIDVAESFEKAKTA